jgi:hypothetical protein
MSFGATVPANIFPDFLHPMNPEPSSPSPAPHGKAPDIQKALRLLRHERPSEAFVDDFLQDFHRRQQRESNTISVWQLMRERVAAFCHDLALPRYALAAGAAYIAVMCTLYLRPAYKPTMEGELAAARERASQRTGGQAMISPGTTDRSPGLNAWAGNGNPMMAAPPSINGVGVPVSASPLPTAIVPGPARTMAERAATRQSGQLIVIPVMPAPNGQKAQNDQPPLQPRLLIVK